MAADLTPSKKTVPSLREFRRRYYPLEAVIKNEIATSRPKWILEELKYDWDDIPRLQGALAQEGVTKVAHVVTGGQAIILDTVHDQFIRLSGHYYESDLPHLPEVLQPLIAQDIGRYRIEFLPRVVVASQSSKSGGELEADRLALIGCLARKGYWFFDATYSNFGYLEDGTPVVIDKGAVKPEKDVLEGKGEEVVGNSYFGRFANVIAGQLAHDWPPSEAAAAEARRTYTASKEIEVPFDFEASQAKHRLKAGFHPGGLVGIVTPQDLAQFRQQRGLSPTNKSANDTAWERLVADSGGLKPVAGRIAEKALATFPDKNEPLVKRIVRRTANKIKGVEENAGLCHRIEAERKKLFDSPER